MDYTDTDSGVTARLQGGLGNQLFIFSAAFALSKRTNQPLTLDTSLLKVDEKRDFELGQIKHGATVRDAFPPRSTLRKLLILMGGKLGLRSTHALGENDTGFFETKEPVTLNGYFQSAKYFIDCEIELKEILRNIEDPSDWYTRELTLSKSVSRMQILVHIRRGDYLSSKARKFHGVLAAQYFANQVNAVQDEIGPSQIIISSDDLDYAHEMSAKYGWAAKILTPTKGSTPLEALTVISQADAIIMSNSSFSWWAGWLAKNEALRIVPEPWYLGSGMSSPLSLQQGWQSVSANFES